VGIFQLVDECPVLTASPREGFCDRAVSWSGEQSQEGLDIAGHNCWSNIPVFWWTILSIQRQGLMERIALEVSVQARQGRGVEDRSRLHFQYRVHHSKVESSIGGRCVRWEIVGSKMGYGTPEGPSSEGGRQRICRVCLEAIGVQSFGRSERQGQVELHEVMEFLVVHQLHNCPHVEGPARKQAQEVVVACCW